MKRINLVWIFVLLMACLSACTKNEYYIVDPEESEQEQVDDSTYTIMMYGCGGGNLDQSMILNIQEALLQGSTDRVKFTGQVKFSDRFQDVEEFKGTQRFIVDAENDNWYTPVEVLDSDLALYDPKNLTDFINWSKENSPADEYILLLWNHGSGWSPKNDHPQSRAIVHDDMFEGRALTLDDLVKGIKDSGTKLKMIYYDACLMGMFEVLTGIKDCAEYALCSSHITPGMGGDYNSIIYHLDKSTNFEDAISHYGREAISHWENEGYPLDFKLVNLSKMDNLLEEIKIFSGYLEDIAQITSEVIDDYKKGIKLNPYDNRVILASTLQKALNSSYNYYWERDEYGAAKDPFFDMLMLAEACVSVAVPSSYSARFVDIASRINRALDEAIVVKYVTSNALGWNFTLGVTIVDDYYWHKKNYDTTYNNLEFDRITNWGKWLSVNPIMPTGNPNPLSILGKDSIGGDDDDDDDDDDGGGGTTITLEQEIDHMLTLIGRR